jgi:hypothetical protein
MQKCESTLTAGSCEGHLGKFDSCQDEALHELSMDADEIVGATEFRGFYARVTVKAAESVTLYNGVKVTVPIGDYVVMTANSGAVYVYDYDAEAFRQEVTAYEAWECPEWCEAPRDSHGYYCQAHREYLESL